MKLDLLFHIVKIPIVLMSDCAKVTPESVNVSVFKLNTAEKTFDLVVFIYLEATITLAIKFTENTLKLPFFVRV